MKNVLILCTGNSCRSPMGEGWLKKEIADRGLENRFVVSSCGVAAIDGMGASDEAVDAVKADNVDISDHKASTLTKERIEKADFIIAMSSMHARQVLGFSPQAADKMIILEIPDPVG